MNISITLSSVSHVGCVRSNNEDMALVTGTFIRDNQYSGRFKLNNDSRFTAIVADGMGGYGGGEIASEMAVKSFDQYFSNLVSGLDELQLNKSLNDWFNAVQNLVISRQSEPGLANMGCTFTGIFSYDGQFFMLNAGDSRVYRLRGEILKQLTIDHSERERLHDPSVPSNLIYNAIGVPNGFLDKFALDSEYPVRNGDIYIICSDGLSDMCDDQTIEQIANEHGVSAAQPLLDAALAAGGRDNCTIIVFEVKINEEEQEQPEEQVAEQPQAPVQSDAEVEQIVTVPLVGLGVIEEECEEVHSATDPVEETEEITDPVDTRSPDIAFNIDDLIDEEAPTTPPQLNPETVIGAQPQVETVQPQPDPGQLSQFDVESYPQAYVDANPESSSETPQCESFSQKIAGLFGRSKKKS